MFTEVVSILVKRSSNLYVFFLSLQHAIVILLVVCHYNVKLMEASVAVGLVWWDVPATPVTMDFMDSLLRDAGVRKFLTFVINTVENC